MNNKMPRGAVPTARSELAASEPYRPVAGAEIFVPSGGFPSPDRELAAALPYKADRAAPEGFINWPVGMDTWNNVNPGNAGWVEEAFAKACASPRVFVPIDVVLSASRQCGLSNFAAFMQTHGFQMERQAYLDGPFASLDWTDAAVLNSAIATVGPVKIGIASTSPVAGAHGQITPGTNGWALYGVKEGEPKSDCASLFGFGPLSILVYSFKQQGVDVRVPSGMPEGLCYAMFSQGSIGIIDRQSLMNIIGEAWVRNPTTIVEQLRG